MTQLVGGKDSAELARAVDGRRRAAAAHDRAVAEHRWAILESARLRRERDQRLIDTEVHATRETLVRALRRRGGSDAVAFLDEDFLRVADRPTTYRAIVDAAVTVAGATSADLQLYDPDREALRIVAQRGFSTEFLAFFAAVGPGQPTACAMALTARKLILVDNVRRSTIFSDRPSMEAVLDAGTRSVHSYPLLAANGNAIGVLSFHRRNPAPWSGRAELVARSAVHVMTHGQQPW